jgi:EamA domain-containing membrane protein RarD
VEQVGGFHISLLWSLCFKMIYLWWSFIKSLLNDETTMKCLIEFLMIVETTMQCRSSSWGMLKQWQRCSSSEMTYLRWIYYCIAINDKLTMRCWLGYYEFRLLMNGCISIRKDLPLYFIECNCDERLYENYEGSTVLLYWI